MGRPPVGDGFSFSAQVIYWRGPAPFLFAQLPDDIAAQIQAVSHKVSYGWGCIPVEAEIAGQAFTTALIPKNDTYLLPLKVAVRKMLPPMEIGDSIAVEMRVAPAGPAL